MDLNVYSVFALLVGLSFGSFFSTLAYRYDYFIYGQGRRKKSNKEKCSFILSEPSHCLSCGHKVKLIYLIPVLGYVLSLGHCFFCKKKISSLYVWGELYFGIYSLLFFQKYIKVFFSSGFFPEFHTLATVDLGLLSFFLIFFAFLFSLIIIGIIYIVIYLDFRHYFIENSMLLLLLVFSFLYVLLMNRAIGFSIVSELYLRLKVALVAFAFFFLVYIFSKGGMGWGDVLLAFPLGFLSSHPWWMFSFNAGFIMAVGFGILTYLQDKRLAKKTEGHGKVQFRKRKLAMGSFLGLGILLVMLMQLLV